MAFPNIDFDQHPDHCQDIHNPFATRYVQPGAIPYFFDPEFIESIKINRPEFYTLCFAESMMVQMELSTWIGCRYLGDTFVGKHFKGQIIGPHGSGKSTLLASLTQVLESQGFPIFSWTFHDQSKNFPARFKREFYQFLNTPIKKSRNAFIAHQPNASQKIVILDGFEQLSFLNRFRFVHFCKKRQIGLLITSHHSRWGFPTLFKTAPTFETLQKIVDYLLEESNFLPGNKLLQDFFHQDRENFRTIFFTLYDWFENKQKK